MRYAASALCLLGCLAPMQSCESAMTDTTEFALYYYGVTDIAPSMSFTLSAPSFIGPDPSDFGIFAVTLDGDSCSTDAFTIDGSTGAVSVNGDGTLKTGLYCLSVECTAGGKSRQFPDAVSLRMLPGVPEGISVDPPEITVALEDVLAGKEIEPAQVTTDGNHITISSYAVANVRRDGVALEDRSLFDVSSDGLVTMRTGSQDVRCGVYAVDLRIVTAAADMTSSEGLFADALTVTVTSAPTGLYYSSSPARVEKGYGHVSSIPDFTGSKDDLIYRLKSVYPSNAPVSVDPITGVITLGEDNALETGTVCRVDLLVSNLYGTTDFYDVYQMTVVDYISPITDFSYEDVTAIRGAAFSNPPAVMDGDEVTYSFGSLDDAVKGSLTLDPYTGVVSAEKGNSVPAGHYVVNVTATNSKSAMTASFTLTVDENPYWFTYVLWGNDLGLEPAADYANQFRQSAGTAGYTVPILDTDLSETALSDLTFSVESLTSGGAVKVGSDGTLDITFKSSYKLLYCDIYIVTVTAGAGLPGETTVRVPVFTSSTVDGVPNLLYTPFVFQVNPRLGGRSAVPALEGVDDPSRFLIDYRRDAAYYNFNGPDSHVSGKVASGNDGSLFLDHLWTSYFEMTGQTVNYGSKSPMSYYANVSDLSLPLGYVSESDRSFVVNPNRWIYDGYYADGFWIGTMTYVTDGNSSNINGGAQMRPVVLWMDTDF